MKEEIIHYAHCVKFTPGQLDREPWSQYELRAVTVHVQHVTDCEINEFRIIHERNVIACEDELEDALALAAYFLMAKSRDLAGKTGQFLKAMKSA